MADIGIPSNSDLSQFRETTSESAANKHLEEECLRTHHNCTSQQEDLCTEGKKTNQINLVDCTEDNEIESEPESNQSDSSQPEYNQPESSQPESNQPESSQPEANQPESSQPVASSSKEVEEEIHRKNHTIWLPSEIKSEFEETQERFPVSEEDEDDCQEEKEEKMDDESFSEDEDDSESGAYHLAEVSYGDDEQDSEKREGAESLDGNSKDLCKTTKPEYSDLKTSKSSKKRSAKNTRLKNEEPKRLKSEKVDPENFVCSICGHMAPSHASLTEHIYKHTKENVQFCAHCNKTFRHRSNLIQHILTKHTDSAQFKCDVCGLAFAKVSAFQRHLRTHTGERPFACTQCNYRSKNAGCLKDHMRKHTGERPYACKHCDYTCSYSSMLSRHIAAQHEKKTYVCNHKTCDYQTNLLRNLTKHLKKHDIPQELACEKCEFTTTCKEKLKNHIIRKHLDNFPINYFVCSFCKMKYREQKSLRRHLLRVHKTDPKGMKFEREIVMTGNANKVKKPSN